jgi:hypothetical protein
MEYTSADDPGTGTGHFEVRHPCPDRLPHHDADISNPEAAWWAKQLPNGNATTAELFIKWLADHGYDHIVASDERLNCEQLYARAFPHRLLEESYGPLRTAIEALWVDEFGAPTPGVCKIREAGEEAEVATRYFSTGIDAGAVWDEAIKKYPQLLAAARGEVVEAPPEPQVVEPQPSPGLFAKIMSWLRSWLPR